MSGPSQIYDVDLKLLRCFCAIVEEGSALPGTIPLMEIELIDIEGEAASVKVVDEFAGMRCSDYLSLVNIDGRWRVVNKVYHLHR